MYIDTHDYTVLFNQYCTSSILVDKFAESHTPVGAIYMSTFRIRPSVRTPAKLLLWKQQ
jgi:hypothetical protein